MKASVSIVKKYQPMITRLAAVRPGRQAAGMGLQTNATRFLFLQRTIGNRAVARLGAQKKQADSTKRELWPVLALRPSAMPDQAGTIPQNKILLRQSRTPVAEYRRQKKGLRRKLAGINKISNLLRRRNKQKEFIKKILVQVLHHNPFNRIEVKKINGNARAQTEWSNPAKQNLGIKVAFDEGIFKDPLPLIIATVIHESVHADQLKAGIAYYVNPALRVGTIEGIYRRAVYCFAEADARIDTLHKFDRVLPKGHKTRILKEISLMLKKADNAIYRMDSSEYQRRGSKYQKWLAALLTGNKLKRGGSIRTIWKRDKAHIGLKNDLLPWRKLP